MMNDEGQDSKTVYSFARIDFCSKYISFALLQLLSTQTFVLLPHRYGPAREVTGLVPRGQHGQPNKINVI